VAALWVVSGLSLAANIAVLVYELYKVRKTGRNPLKEEIYTDLPAYQKVAQLKTVGTPQSAAQPNLKNKPQSVIG
jgi:hypothetical protein